MVKRHCLTVLALFAAILITGCGAGGGGVSSTAIGGSDGDIASKYASSDLAAASVDKNITSACNSFAISLFGELARSSAPQDNIFISPFSVSSALSMAANGAAGNTLSEMLAALSFGGMDVASVNAGYKSLAECLAYADAGVSLKIANSLWIRDSFEPFVKRAFIDTLSTFFSCPPRALDFNSPQASSSVNSWVESNTGGLIKSVVTEIPPEIVMFLINAIYFKGDWTESFDTASTVAGTFKSPAGDITARFMSASGGFKYYAGAGYSALRLPYGRGKIAMYIFLPSPETTFDAFFNAFGAAEHERAMAAMASSVTAEVKLKMPKFKFEYGVKRLNDALKALGMKAAFDPSSADLSNIASSLYIAFVDHKAVIDVNEKGSEAAAVTVIGVGATSVPVDPPLNFTADRPFLFTIRDDRTGCVLFMGKVASPAGY